MKLIIAIYRLHLDLRIRAKNYGFSIDWEWSGLYLNLFCLTLDIYWANNEF